MNYVVLFDFFSDFSLPTLIIATVSAVIKLVLNKFLSKKLGARFLTFIPFAVSILLHFAYGSVFIHRALYFGEDTTAAGMISGSLAMGISALYKKLRSGNFTEFSDGVSLVIEGIIRNYVRSDVVYLAVLTVKTIILEALSTDEYDLDALIDSVADAVKEYAHDQTTEQDRKTVATLAVESVKNLNDE